VTAPPRRRRPAKGAHSAEDEINPQPYATEM
jgi:hypothetical protein